MEHLASFEDVDFDLDRESFLLDLVRELSGTLESSVGLEQAKGFVSMVGRHIGASMNADYQRKYDQDKLDRDHVAAALVDLKRRINGGFSVESISEDSIVLVNSQCPFGDRVKERKSLCMMTTNVFGRIAAENLGYSRVEITESIAQGNDRCHVIVHLKPPSDEQTTGGYEYFAS